jgi:L-erythro-3,5-diaminohexanoate dehydrogenase
MSQAELWISPYGLHRVIGQPGVLPQPAERFDARDAVRFAQLTAPQADLTVCCVNQPGTEPSCILATKPRGHILFFSMVTDFARAVLCAEGLGSGVTLEIGNGFLPGHADYVVDLLRRNQHLASHLSC